MATDGFEQLTSWNIGKQDITVALGAGDRVTDAGLRLLACTIGPTFSEGAVELGLLGRPQNVKIAGVMLSRPWMEPEGQPGFARPRKHARRDRLQRLAEHAFAAP